jgi:microcystin-dependent protein
MSGQLYIAYKPPAISASSYATSQLLLSNTGSADNPPQLGFQASGLLGMSLYLNASGLNAITHLGGSSLIINTSGQLNALSFADGSIPGTKLVPGSVGTAQITSASITNALLAPGSVDASKFAAGTLNSIQNAVGLPVGAIIMYGGITWNALPSSNWAFCDGSAVSRTTYSALYAVLGTLYGSGNGSSTFNLPDFRSRVPIGCGTWTPSAWVAGGGLPGIYSGWAWGEWSHTLTTAEMPAHAHSVYDPTHAHSVYDPTHFHGIGDPGHSHAVTQSGHAHGVSDPGHNHWVDVHFNLGTHPAGGPYSAMESFQSGQDLGTSTEVTNISINAANANIGIYGAGTGIGIYGAATGIGIYGASTGIGIYNAGGGAAHNIIQPSLGCMFIIKLLPGG